MFYPSMLVVAWLQLLRISEDVCGMVQGVEHGLASRDVAIVGLAGGLAQRWLLVKSGVKSSC